VPSLLAQGAVDTLVLPDARRRFVAHLCAASQAVDFRVYAGRDHVPLVEADSPLIPELLAWTEARLAGEPAPTECSTTER
jgi:hypothetical protein